MDYIWKPELFDHDHAQKDQMVRFLLQKSQTLSHPLWDFQHLKIIRTFMVSFESVGETRELINAANRKVTSRVPS